MSKQGHLLETTITHEVKVWLHIPGHPFKPQHSPLLNNNNNNNDDDDDDDDEYDDNDDDDDDDNNNNNKIECIFRVPFHVKHAQLR